MKTPQFLARFSVLSVLLVLGLWIGLSTGEAALNQINVGTSANDGTGDPLRTAFLKLNTNMTLVVENKDGLATNLTVKAGLTVVNALTNSALTASKPVFTAADKTLTSTGTVPLDQGGTAKALTAVNGGLVYSDADSFEITAALSGILQGNGAAAPTAITGTANKLPVWSASAPYLGSSIIAQSGTFAGINTTSPANPLHTSTSSEAWRSDIRVGGFSGQGGAFIANMNDASRLIIFGGAEPTNNPAGANWANPVTTSASGVKLESGTITWYGDTGLSAGTVYSPTVRMSLSAAGVLSLPGLTQKSIPFIGASGAVNQDNPNLQYDSTAASLAIGTTTSTQKALLIVRAGAKTDGQIGLEVQNNATSSTASINKYGIVVYNSGTWNGSGANNYGVFIDTVSGGTANWGFYNSAAADNQLGGGTTYNSGKTAFTPSTLQTLAAGNALLANATKVRVAGSGGAVTLTSTPTIADGVDGQIVYILGTHDTNTLTVQDQGTLASSNLELAASTRVLGKGDILQLMFDATDSVWYEVSFANN